MYTHMVKLGQSHKEALAITDNQSRLSPGQVTDIAVVTKLSLQAQLPIIVWILWGHFLTLGNVLLPITLHPQSPSWRSKLLHLCFQQPLSNSVRSCLPSALFLVLVILYCPAGLVLRAFPINWQDPTFLSRQCCLYNPSGRSCRSQSNSQSCSSPIHTHVNRSLNISKVMDIV